MPRFDHYLRELQVREGLAPVPLIRQWTLQESTAIIRNIRFAVRQSGLIGSAIPNFVGTNQSKGNKAADHFFNLVPPQLRAGNRIAKAGGAGYPDMLYSIGGTGFCMEMKATSKWKPRDSNRRVLTSSPRKLLRLLQARAIDDPPAHFICTLQYDDTAATVRQIRLDFLESDSTVNIRLEASTSQKLLESGAHRRYLIA